MRRGGGGLGSWFYVVHADRCKRIQTWALEEARRRLEIEGVVEDSTKARKITDVVKTVSGK
jgi:hypothetical protein